MGFLFEIIKFIIFSLIIVYVSKEILVKLLRKIAEILDLSPKTVGNIAGFATSVPELLTVFFSSFQGLIGTSIYNIISSNVINFIQYIGSIKINKNEKLLNNMALKVEIGIVIMTILIPIGMVIWNIEASVTVVPIFVLLFIMFLLIKRNAYRVYNLQETSDEEKSKIEEEKKWVRHKERLAAITIIQIIATGVLLFIVGNLLRKYFRSAKE